MHRHHRTISAALRILILPALTLAACTSGQGATAPLSTTPPTTAAPLTTSPSTDSSTSDAAPTTVPTIGEKEPWVAFQGFVGERYGVLLARPDGTDRHFAFPATPAGTQDHPDWSPDGNRIVYTLEADDGTKDMWLGNIATRVVRQLLDCAAPCRWIDEPAWSPDGNRIVFHRETEVNGQLVSTLEIMNYATGGSPQVILTAPTKTVYLAPRWSPGGARLVVEVLQLPEASFDAEPVGDGIGVLDLAHPDAGIRMLTDFAHFAQNPDWSWVTNRILYAAYSADGSSATDLFTIDPDGTNRRQVTHMAPTGLAREATFTPDGAGIVFGGSTNVNANKLDLDYVAIDGSGMTSATGSANLTGAHPRVRPV